MARKGTYSFTPTIPTDQIGIGVGQTLALALMAGIEPTGEVINSHSQLPTVAP
jgi:hypothetical protein